MSASGRSLSAARPPSGAGSIAANSKVDSIWLSERLVGAQPVLEPLTALAAIGGRTRRLKFGMNTILPLRDPLVLAKECATIDYLSDGRFLPMFGVGADVAPEWHALGMDTRAVVSARTRCSSC